MYTRLAGMTGTAVTEAEEFQKIYKLDVVVVPTNNPLVRNDESDAVYKSTRAKLTAVVDEIEKVYATGQPVLVGTTSIEKNEMVSQLLRRRGVKHEVLNAKNHVREAQIIADAGKKGAITVATNMAGRGVDIVLGGDSPKHADGRPMLGTKEWRQWENGHKEVLELGGLYVIGTERHESRRIDNQLRGRSGRQGDPGKSRFYVSLDDEIMRLFGGDRISSLMTRFNMPEDVPLEHPLVSRSIEHAQVKVEGFNFDIRKHLVEYDDVLNKQREVIYALRKDILLKTDTEKGFSKEEILRRVDTSIETAVTLALAGGEKFGDADSANEAIVSSFSSIIPFDDTSKKQLIKQLQQEHTAEDKSQFLIKLARDLYEKKEKQLGNDLTRQIEKYVLLGTINKVWMDHLDAIDDLRQGIGLRGYAQKDPLVEYKNEAFRMFEQLMFSIDDEVVHRIFKVQVQASPETHHHDHIHTNTPETEISTDIEKAAKRKKTVAVSSTQDTLTPQKPGRNDPCWCGSGKKYKKCHYPN
jgi:preprotein translocase subunit SecA